MSGPVGSPKSSSVHKRSPGLVPVECKSGSFNLIQIYDVKISKS